MKNKIVVIGSSNVDLIMKMDRLPEKGETITDADFFQVFGGKGANQAVGAARAGGNVAFVNCVGNDAYTPQMLENFRNDGLDIRFVFQETGIASGHALVMIGGEGDNYLSVAPGANYKLTPELIDRSMPVIDEAAMIIMQYEIPVETIQYVFGIAEAKGIPVLWNFAPARSFDLSYVKKTAILVVNEAEAAFLCGQQVETDEEVELAAIKLLKLGAKLVIITLGKRGAFALSATEKVAVPAFKVNAVDTTSAGDVFCGSFAVAQTEGKTITESMQFASAASAICVTRIGAQPSAPARKEIDKFLEKNRLAILSNMKKLKIGFVIILTALSLNLFSQVKLIFDTDFGGDADDLGALAMLHHLAAKGECELLAIMCWTTEQNAVPAIDAVNRFYKHPDVPIGVRKAGSHFDPTSYSKPIAEDFYHELNYQTAIDATALYRKILAENDDKSITIVVVGPLKNIENLIRSKGDIHSKLDGKTLVSKKVKEFVIMGGQYPEGKKEWNFDGNMPGITRYVIQNIDVPITFSGFELGVNIKTGEVFNQIDKNTPLFVGFKYFSEHATWMKQHYKGQILNNSTYDQTAVLYAVRNGLGIYWDRSENGVCLPDEVGGNKWQENRDGKHSYLKLKMSNNDMARLIESLMSGVF